jgi:N6-adenosine-specific RNA methylase IME4
VEIQASRAIVKLPSIPEALRVLGKMRIEVKRADNFLKLDHLANKAAGMQRAFKDVEAVANEAGDVWADAEIRVRQEYDKLERAKGTRGQIARDVGGRIKPGGLKSIPPGDPTITELGLDKNRLARGKRLVALTPEQRNEAREILKAQGKAINPSSLLGALRMKAREEKKQQLLTAVFSVDGPFDAAVIDFPWEMEKIDREVRPNQDAFDYNAMKIDEMVEFWNNDLSPRLSPDCHVFLWTTQKYLPAAFDLLKRFDVRYVLTMVWHKPGGFQPVGLPQYNCEFIVYGRRGSPPFIDTTKFDCCFEAPRREHSRKPDFFYDTIRRVTGGSRIDVFSREPREGFAQYGNEIGKFAA